MRYYHLYLLKLATDDLSGTSMRLLVNIRGRASFSVTLWSEISRDLNVGCSEVLVHRPQSILLNSFHWPKSADWLRRDR